MLLLHRHYTFTLSNSNPLILAFPLLLEYFTLGVYYDRIQGNKVSTMEDDTFERLKIFMAKLPVGFVTPEMQDELTLHLMECWHMFSGSDEDAMAAYKLKRMENPSWNPPILDFDIERHGATAMGSTKAEIQGWQVDFNMRAAKSEKMGYRQIYPRDAALDVKPIADELSRLVVTGARDDRLQWSAAGCVRILSGKIIPSVLSPKQTVEGRRNRLVKALEERLTLQGWERRGSWWKKII